MGIRGLRNRAERIATPSQRVQFAAREHAFREISDREALGHLRAALDGVSGQEIDTQIASWHMRDSYLEDRACRLLIGLQTGVVPNISDDQRERFDRELRLGHLPLREAFAQIAHDDPTLRDLEGELSGLSMRPAKAANYVIKSKGSSPILGNENGFEHDLALAYLVRLSSGKLDDRSYFENPLFRHRLHGTLGGSPSGATGT